MNYITIKKLKERGACLTAISELKKRFSYNEKIYPKKRFLEEISNDENLQFYSRWLAAKFLYNGNLHLFFLYKQKLNFKYRNLKPNPKYSFLLYNKFVELYETQRGSRPK